MPKPATRARRRKQGTDIPKILLVFFVIIAAGLVYLLAKTGLQTTSDEKKATIYPENPEFVEQSGGSEPIVLGAEIVEATTAEPLTLVTQSAQTPQPTAKPSDEERLRPSAEPYDYFLPVYDRADRSPDDELMICIMIEACDRPQILEEMIRIARNYNCELTLCPRGDALMDESTRAIFVRCVKEYGYEIECCTYDKKNDYELTPDALMLQAWKQSLAVSYALDGDYTQHFYRATNRYSTVNQISHFVAGKLGFKGVCGYTYNVADYADEDALLTTLDNGVIYNFNMTQKALNKMEALLAEANRKGYRMVSLNTLFGIEEENTLSKNLTVLSKEMPLTTDYTASYYPLKLYNRAYAVFDIQSRLMSLGYLSTRDAEGNVQSADGIFGPNTSKAVSRFQARVGLPATGSADVETQQALFAINAPEA